MDDDDKFWRVPEGHSWKEAAPMLRALRERQRPSRAPVATPRTPGEMAEHYSRLAAFYTRIGRDYEARECAARAERIQRRAHG